MLKIPPPSPDDQLRGCKGLLYGLLLSLLFWTVVILLLWLLFKDL